jgi:outer membrane protein TolC
LELNKAKIAWMQEQFNVEQIEIESRNVLLSLQNLNGGQPVVFDQAVYADDLGIATYDSIWQQKIATDPALKVLEGKETVSLQQIYLEKNKVFPNLTAGFNYQGVMGQNYSGIYGGISLPLWRVKNKIKAAEAQYQYQQSHTDAIFTELYTNFQKQYNQYDHMLLKYREYQTILGALNTENLLLEAYQLGEISFMEYYIELQFYHQAYDMMLQMEKKLNQLKADLLKHQL